VLRQFSLVFVASLSALPSCASSRSASTSAYPAASRCRTPTDTQALPSSFEYDCPGVLREPGARFRTLRGVVTLLLEAFELELSSPVWPISCRFLVAAGPAGPRGEQQRVDRAPGGRTISLFVTIYRKDEKTLQALRRSLPSRPSSARTARSAANHIFKSWGSLMETTSPAPARTLARVPRRLDFSASLEDSLNRDAVQVSLDRASVEGVHASRRSEHYPLTIDSAYSRQVGYLLLGMKSSCGDSW
jgi:hypothetical protein